MHVVAEYLKRVRKLVLEFPERLPLRRGVDLQHKTERWHT